MVNEDAHAPNDLSDLWGRRAAFLREYGDPNGARLWELAATELQRAIEAHGDETLSLTEAGRVSGYSPDHLSRLIRRGIIANAGRAGAPRIRRGDVPIKNPNGAGRPSTSTRKNPFRERAQSVARAFSRKR